MAARFNKTIAGIILSTSISLAFSGIAWAEDPHQLTGPIPEILGRH